MVAQKIAVKGRVHSVETMGAVDGPGIRFVIFVQGCPLKCIYCHNPDTWDECGGEATDSEIMANTVMEYKNYIKNGGVTISGGEPLFQPEFVLDILQRCKEEGIHTAVDTSGSVSLKIAKPIIDAADMLLLDIKAYDDELCVEMTGKGNQNTFAMLNYCEVTRKPVWIRHVLVPGYTLNSERLHDLAEYLSQYRCIEKVELLPFHKMGEYKWKTLNYDYKLGEVKEPTRDETDEAIEIFKNYGLPL